MKSTQRQTTDRAPSRFDLRKVNTIRGRLRRGAYQVDGEEIAARLLFEHLFVEPTIAEGEREES